MKLGERGVGRIEIYGGFKEGNRMKPYLHGPMK